MGYAKMRTGSAIIEPSIISGASADTLFTKSKQNTSGVTIALNSLVALKNDGGIVAADSDAANGQIVIGIATEEILAGAYGGVRLFAPNIADALTGLGFTVGQELYLSQSGGGGFTADLASLTDNNDSVISVGYADCTSGTTGTVATDLIAFNSVVMRP